MIPNNAKEGLCGRFDTFWDVLGTKHCSLKHAKSYFSNQNNNVQRISKDYALKSKVLKLIQGVLIKDCVIDLECNQLKLSHTWLQSFNAQNAPTWLSHVIKFSNAYHNTLASRDAEKGNTSNFFTCPEVEIRMTKH